MRRQVHLKILLIAVGVMATVAATSGNAAAALIYPDFTINESGVSTGGIVNCTTLGSCVHQADNMVGSYAERFTVTGPGTFSTVAYWNLSGFSIGDEDTPTPVLGTSLNSLEVLGGYKAYALFSSVGTFSTAITGVTTFTAVSGCVNLYADVDSNTSLATPTGAVPTTPLCTPETGAAPAFDAIVVGGAGDDIPLAAATLLSGSGTFDPANPQAKGNFGITFNPFLLAAPGGETYFQAPRPFYLTALLKGNFNSDPTSGGAGSSADIGGAANAFFAPQVPEPGTLTLLGFGLVGLGRRFRRKTAA